MAEGEWGVVWGVGFKKWPRGDGVVSFFPPLSSPHPQLESLCTGYNKLNLTFSLAGQGKRW